jgi:hypothetical protein
MLIKLDEKEGSLERKKLDGRAHTERYNLMGEGRICSLSALAGIQSSFLPYLVHRCGTQEYHNVYLLANMVTV